MFSGLKMLSTSIFYKKKLTETRFNKRKLFKESKIMLLFDDGWRTETAIIIEDFKYVSFYC